MNRELILSIAVFATGYVTCILVRYIRVYVHVLRLVMQGKNPNDEFMELYKRLNEEDRE